MGSHVKNQLSKLVGENKTPPSIIAHRLFIQELHFSRILSSSTSEITYIKQPRPSVRFYHVQTKRPSSTICASAIRV